MDQLETPSFEFTKGFNDAQLVADYNPTLLASITPDVNSNDEYFNGFFAFKHEQELLHTKNNLNELKNIRNRSQTLDRPHEI